MRCLQNIFFLILHFPLAPAVTKILWFSFLYVHSKEKIEGL